MGTTTTNLGLYKPTVGEIGWGTLFNSSLDVVDGAVSPGPLTRYVDYANGLDTYNGRSPSRAYKTIQACYNDLKAYAIANYTYAGRLAIGRIILLPGDHDVGAGFLIDGSYVCELVGLKPGSLYTQDTTSRIVSSSSSATYLVKVNGTAGVLAMGGHFYDLDFRVDTSVNTAMTKLLYAANTNHLNVKRCSFQNTQSTEASVTGIYQESKDDSSWARIMNNQARKVQFYQAATDVANGIGTNYNRTYIHENVVFYGGSLPMIHLAGDWYEGSVSFNNLEGNACAIEAGSTERGLVDHNVFIQNSGESTDASNPFYRFVNPTGVSGPDHCLIIGGNCSCGVGNFGTWVDFSVGSGRNFVIGDVDYVGRTAFKAKIVDASTLGNNIIVNPTYGSTIKTKSGAGATIADSDFGQVGQIHPWDGLVGVTHDTSSGADKFWVRSNGAWKSVTLA